MSTTKTSSLTSSNFWNNVIGALLGVLLAFFTPNADLAAQVSAEVTNLVAAVKAANWTGFALVLFNLGNILYHVFRNK